MSVRNAVILAVMALIIIVVAAIFVFGGEKTPESEKRLAEAKSYYEMLDYDKAIAIYNDVISKEAACAEAYIGLADAYVIKGNNEKAAEILERGLDATNGDERIADKIYEMSGVPAADDENVIDAEDAFIEDEDVIYDNEDVVYDDTSDEDEIIEEIDSETTAVSVSETETETTTETTVTTTETTVTTTEATTTTPAATTAPPATTTARPVVTTVKPTIEMPNIIGITKDEAKAICKKKNINLSFEYEDNDTYANGVIFYQSNREGTLVSPQTKVVAYVCVNDQELVTEDDLNLEAFYNAAKSWGNANSDKISSVTLSERNDTVTVNVSSAKRFSVDASVMAALKECNGANLLVKTADAEILINSNSVTSSDKLNLSTDVSGNESRLTLKIGSEGDFNCTATVTITDCDIEESALEDMKVYRNDKKFSNVSLGYNNEPVLTISDGGTYTIK